MTDNLSWALNLSSLANGTAVLIVGVMLGVIFFGGLWWTVKRGAASPTPKGWFLVSFFLRNIIALGGFYAVGAGQPLRLGICLLGFILGRAIVLRWSRSLPPTTLHTPEEPPCA